MQYTPSLRGAALGKHPSGSGLYKENAFRDSSSAFQAQLIYVLVINEFTHIMYVSGTVCIISKIIM